MSPVAGGLNSQLGFAEEAAPGIPLTVTRFLEFDSESLSEDFDRVQHMGLRPTRKFLGSNNYSVGRQKASGDVDIIAQTLNQAFLWKHALGASATTAPAGGTLARQHLATVGAIDGKSLTCQVGLADDGGVARAKTLAGCKIAKWKFSVKENDFPKLSLSLDAMSSDMATALAVASYPAGVADYFGAQFACKIAGAAVDCSSFELDYDNGLMLDRYYMRTTTPTIKKEQLEGDKMREAKGKVTLAFPDLVAYNRFRTNAQTSLQITLTGAIIEGVIPYSLDFTMAAVRWDGNTPAVNGVGLIPIELDFTVVDSGAANGPLAVTSVSTDVAP